MAVLYIVCVGVLTFYNGPATYAGNQYFSAWAGFFISFSVVGNLGKEFLGVGGKEEAAAARSDGKCFLLVQSAYLIAAAHVYSILRRRGSFHCDNPRRGISNYENNG